MFVYHFFFAPVYFVFIIISRYLNFVHFRLRSYVSIQDFQKYSK